MSNLTFIAFNLVGVDAQKFLQGQVTANVEALTESVYFYTGICNLKGRLEFGLWIKKINPEHFQLVTTQDLAENLAKHIKKFGAFSKMTLTEIGTVFPIMQVEQTEFVNEPTDLIAWQQQAIGLGQAWINAQTSNLFQPQELRLHQRNGVHYDKGCYLGQEIVARLWFKAKPKHWLHLIQGQGYAPQSAEKLHADVEVVNSIENENGFMALVVAKPDALASLDVQVLALPEALNGNVARP